MVKIKVKKEMNLHQLIQWVRENGVKDKTFKSNYGRKVKFYSEGLFYTMEPIFRYDIFTVEVEEDLTKNTVIPKLMTTFKKTYLKYDFGYQRVRIDENHPIRLMLNRAEEHTEPIETLHMVNDDGTHTLIWRDGKLVE